jgi:hypothetical protein
VQLITFLEIELSRGPAEGFGTDMDSRRFKGETNLTLVSSRSGEGMEYGRVETSAVLLQCPAVPPSPRHFNLPGP